MYYLSANFFSFTWEVDLLQCRSLPSLSYNVPLLSRKKKTKKLSRVRTERLGLSVCFNGCNDGCGEDDRLSKE